MNLLHFSEMYLAYRHQYAIKNKYSLITINLMTIVWRLLFFIKIKRFLIIMNNYSFIKKRIQKLRKKIHLTSLILD